MMNGDLRQKTDDMQKEERGIKQKHFQGMKSEQVLFPTFVWFPQKRFPFPRFPW